MKTTETKKIQFWDEGVDGATLILDENNDIISLEMEIGSVEFKIEESKLEKFMELINEVNRYLEAIKSKDDSSD